MASTAIARTVAARHLLRATAERGGQLLVPTSGMSVLFLYTKRFSHRRQTAASMGAGAGFQTSDLVDDLTCAACAHQMTNSSKTRSGGPQLASDYTCI
jgi:hypothetical protein